jgi:hypothetical protein
MALQRRLPDSVRFFLKVDIHGPGGCWLYTGSATNHGYGQFWRGGRGGSHVGAHRYAWEVLRGPITAETLDHLCRVKTCVNPAHLEPVSLRENLRRHYHGKH